MQRQKQSCAVQVAVSRCSYSAPFNPPDAAPHEQARFFYPSLFFAGCWVSAWRLWFSLTCSKKMSVATCYHLTTRIDLGDFAVQLSQLDWQ